jgi:hypothetical protein
MDMTMLRGPDLVDLADGFDDGEHLRVEEQAYAEALQVQNGDGLLDRMPSGNGAQCQPFIHLDSHHILQ